MNSFDLGHPVFAFVINLVAQGFEHEFYRIAVCYFKLEATNVVRYFTLR